jgi:hypothetical protein
MRWPIAFPALANLTIAEEAPVLAYHSDVFTYLVIMFAAELVCLAATGGFSIWLKLDQVLILAIARLNLPSASKLRTYADDLNSNISLEH